MTNPTYTTRKAAVVGARRALMKEGVSAPLNEVHFKIVEGADPFSEADTFTFTRIDVHSGLTEEQQAAAVPTTSDKEWDGAAPGVTTVVGVTTGRQQGKSAQAERLSAAAKEALAEGPKEAATPAVAPSLPIPSGDPAKDAEMPALRRNAKPTELEAKGTVYPRRAGSKQAILIDLLARPQGATFAEIYDAMAATGKPWVAATIRSGLAWDVNHIAGYGVTSELCTGEEFAAQGRVYEAERLGVTMNPNGQGWSLAPGHAYDPTIRLCVYRLTYPKGITAPLAHTPRAADKKAAG